MTRNPILNALAAVGYIAVIATFIIYSPVFLAALPLAKAPTVFAPIAALSLFVFSAALMGYLFLYQPLLFVLAGEKKEGTALFLKTVGSFGIIALLFVIVGLIATTIL